MSKISSVSYNDITSYNLLRKLLKNDPNQFSLAGLTKTTNKHSYLKWEKKSIWEIARQLQYLEWKAGNPVECYVDVEGVLHFGKNINTEQGYKFTASGDGTNTIISYDETLTTDNVVTVGRVVATWGYIEGDAVDCTENVTKGGSTSSTSSDTNSDGQAFINKYNINNKIVKQANSIIGSAKTDNDKAKAIWKWMRNNIKYSNYACTKKGALGTLNCNHIKGHFYPETKLNGKWFATDTTTSKGWGNHAMNGGHLAYYSNPNTFNC